MNDDTGVDYMRAWELGATVLGLGGVGEVLESKNKEFCAGDIVHSAMNWPWTIIFKSKPSKTFPIKKVHCILTAQYINL